MTNEELATNNSSLSTAATQVPQRPPRRRTRQQVISTLPIGRGGGQLAAEAANKNHKDSICRGDPRDVVLQQQQQEEEEQQQQELTTTMLIQKQKYHRFYTMAEEYLERRRVEVQATYKCPDCWFPLPWHKRKTTTTTTQIDNGGGGTSKNSTKRDEMPQCICEELRTRIERISKNEAHHSTTARDKPHQPGHNDAGLLLLHNHQQHAVRNPPPLLHLSIPVRIIIYMHYLEWMNGGNSGKLLLKLFNGKNTLPRREEEEEDLPSNIAPDDDDDSKNHIAPDDDNDSKNHQAPLCCQQHSEWPVVQLFLYGKRNDDDKLKRMLEESDADRTALLFPSRDAMTVGDFWRKATSNNKGNNATNSTAASESTIQQLQENLADQARIQKETITGEGNGRLATKELPTQSTCAQAPLLTLVVVDATYKKAKNMVKHFHKRIVPKNVNGNCRIPTVKLDWNTISPVKHSSRDASSTYTSSIFARAQKSYGKKNGSGSSFAKGGDSSSIMATTERDTTPPASNHGRVCTVEAVAYALQECGETQEIVDALLEAIRVNNEAVKYFLYK